MGCGEITVSPLRSLSPEYSSISGPALSDRVYGVLVDVYQYDWVFVNRVLKILSRDRARKVPATSLAGCAHGNS